MADAKIALTGQNFDETARADLLQIDGVDNERLEFYRNEFENGRVMCLGINLTETGARIGTGMFCFIDDPEKCLVAMEVQADPTKTKGFNFLAEIDQQLTAWAQATGAKSVRFWTKRKGFLRVGEPLGYVPQFVMEKTL